MAKKRVTFQVDMEDITKYALRRKRQPKKTTPFSRLGDYDYRKFFIRRVIIYIIIAIFCSAFMLLLSASTSPLYKEFCDGDSSIFMVVGKGITLGKAVYRDYFDHKGPILFYLNALGFWLTGGKSGVFIVQCVFFSLTAIFMYKTARIFTKTGRSLICVLLAILAFASTISDGNLSEEYCMLFCMIPIYLAVKFYTKTPDDPHPPKYMLAYGICFGICAFIRINNGLMIGGIVLVALITDFASDNIKNAVLNILAFFGGVLTVTAPICLFFIIKGTFSDMVFATFIFNFLYAAEGSSGKSGSEALLLLQWIIPVIALIVISVVFSKRLGARVASLIVAVSIFALIPALMGFSYTHYYTTLIPLISLYCAVFFYIATQRINFGSVLMCIVMALPLYSYFITLPYNVTHYSEKLYKQYNPTVYRDVQSSIAYSATELSALIPEEDRDSVFGYDVPAAWFLEADIMPCHRLFTLQESWAEHYPDFGREINEMMVSSPPKWVVIHNIDIIESRQFLGIINDEYELESEFGYDLLYMHKE